KRAYCLKTQPATGETYPKSDLFNKAPTLLSFLGSRAERFEDKFININRLHDCVGSWVAVTPRAVAYLR
ncbi:hypothetical protein LA449_22230, partial [Escherichia coli]|uniref:hypothetical protein n=1 Tax=Escherichia coli TaxID=562 RepID=UPI001CCC5120